MNPTYDIQKSYDENFQRGPKYDGEFPVILPTVQKHKLLDFQINSPVGVAAGLLLNSKWVDLYARLGFDVLTYKTVRSEEYQSHPSPNCLYVDTSDCLDIDENVPLCTRELEPLSLDNLSITNSFGVPSPAPNYWRRDVEKAKSCLKKGQVLIVSVVGTSKEHKDLDGFVKDFQLCAKWAKEAGADIVELDLSCPNSPVQEGEIFRLPELSSRITKAVKQEIKETPLFIKIGYFKNYQEMENVISVNAPFINGVAGINTIKKKIITPSGKPALPGKGREKSGICGSIIRELGVKSAKNLIRLRAEKNYDFAIIGIGGAMTPEHISEYLEIGVDVVQVVTAAMYDPLLAYKYREYILRLEDIPERAYALC